MSANEKSANNTITQPKKQRSPSFPIIPIDEAINRVRLIYERDRRAFTTANAVLEHLGYSSKKGMSGTSGRVVAALKQYGLLDEQGGQYRVSDLAFRILNLPDDSEERQELIRNAALAPPIFKKLLTFYQGEVPSDAALRSQLVLHEKFNPDSVDQFIRVFRRIIEIANPSAEDYNVGGDSEGGSQQSQGATPMQQPQTPPPFRGHPSPEARQAFSPAPPSPVGNVPPPADGFQFQISERSVNVLFNGVVTQEAIKKLIKYLEISVDDFPSKKELERAGSRAEVDRVLEETERELNEGAE